MTNIYNHKFYFGKGYPYLIKFPSITFDLHISSTLPAIIITKHNANDTRVELYVSSESRRAVPRFIQWSGLAAPLFRSTLTTKEALSAVPALSG